MGTLILIVLIALLGVVGFLGIRSFIRKERFATIVYSVLELILWVALAINIFS